MLAQELAWLPADLRESLLVSSPARFALHLSQGLYHYAFEATGITGLLHALDAAPASAPSGLVPGLRALLLPARDYLAAAMNITQVFGLRLAVLVLSSPVFVLFGLVGLTEGLVRRDLRRWRGGWEIFLRLPSCQARGAAAAGRGGHPLSRVAGERAPEPHRAACGGTLRHGACHHGGDLQEIPLRIPRDATARDAGMPWSRV